MIEKSKDSAFKINNNNSRVLLNNVPDYLYGVRSNVTWTHGSFGDIVYSVYHMYDYTTCNAMNYIMRAYFSKITVWRAQSFDAAFSLSHNIWVQYNAYLDEAYIFDNRASNARILISPTVTISLPDNEKDGYFAKREVFAYVNGSKSRNVAAVIIGYVPVLGDISNIYNTLTSSTATEIGSTKYFERNNVRSAGTYQSNLKYAPNDRNYSQDMVGINVIGQNVGSVRYKLNYGFKVK